LVVVGLFFLGDAFFSGWVAGGPPTEYKLGWERRALASLFLAGASFFAAGAAFRLPRIGKASWFLLLLAMGLALFPLLAREILIDSCLDSGGSWSYEFLECVR
jgi:hypothetical protein